MNLIDKQWEREVKKMKKITLIIAFFLSFFLFSQQNTFAAESCASNNGFTKVWWNGVELKEGQIGRLSIVHNTSLYQLNGTTKTFKKTLKSGRFYRIYSFKSDMLGLGGGYFVDSNTKVTYETPSKEKLQALQCAKNQSSSTKTYLVKEIVAQNDSKVVMITTDKNVLGSGVVIKDGLILTNYHVIQGAKKAYASFIYRNDLEIEGIVAFDAKKDYALLKTKTYFSDTGVKFIQNPNVLAKGDLLVGIGSPRGLQNTISTGIISAFREYDGVKLIQNNVDVDHGSSGGPLFNMEGEVVGLTTMGIDDSKAHLNFALSSTEFVNVINKYKNSSFISIKASF
jgi:S1-C subfamily serine protease